MKTRVLLSSVVGLILMAGCAKSVRSVSNANYRDPAHHWPTPPATSDPAFAYRGELSEFDVLGLTRDFSASEADIATALEHAKGPRLKPGASILLIQSGAIFPDGPMVTELSKHYRVVPFSGVPPVSRRTEDGPLERYDAQNFATSLRLAAARGGCDTVLCYWGILESESAKLATKTVSWVPVVNWLVPDENQHMRIRLKFALVDVRTGNWAVLSSAPSQGSKLSFSPRRNVADQKLVEGLKQKAYAAGAKELQEHYADVALN